MLLIMRKDNMYVVGAFFYSDTSDRIVSDRSNFVTYRCGTNLNKAYSQCARDWQQNGASVDFNT